MRERGTEARPTTRPRSSGMILLLIPSMNALNKLLLLPASLLEISSVSLVDSYPTGEEGRDKSSCQHVNRNSKSKAGGDLPLHRVPHSPMREDLAVFQRAPHLPQVRSKAPLWSLPVVPRPRRQEDPQPRGGADHRVVEPHGRVRLRILRHQEGSLGAPKFM